MSGPPDEIVVGDGHPDFSGWGLTEDEEKRVDDKGRLVVQGAPWSQVGSGLWLVVYLLDTLGERAIDRRVRGSGNVYLGMSKRIVIGVTDGRPVVLFRGILGACLELPSDLAQDPLKVQYVTEWISHTIAEIGAKGGISVSKLVKHGPEFAQMAERAIRESGL